MLTSLGLGTFVHRGWYFLAVFVGLNLVQSAFTDFCPVEKVLLAMGVKKEKDL